MTITLCAVSSANISATERALLLSQRQMKFDDTIFVTNADVSTNENYRIEKCPVFTDRVESWNYAFYEIPKLIKTDHVLFVQYDGYILDGNYWSRDFLKYDYIGAKTTRRGISEAVAGVMGASITSLPLTEFVASLTTQTMDAPTTPTASSVPV